MPARGVGHWTCETCGLEISFRSWHISTIGTHSGMPPLALSGIAASCPLWHAATQWPPRDGRCAMAAVRPCIALATALWPGSRPSERRSPARRWQCSYNYPPPKAAGPPGSFQYRNVPEILQLTRDTGPINNHFWHSRRCHHSHRPR